MRGAYGSNPKQIKRNDDAGWLIWAGMHVIARMTPVSSVTIHMTVINTYAYVCVCVPVRLCVCVCVWSMLSGPRSDYKLQWQYALHSMRIDCICIMYILI